MPLRRKLNHDAEAIVLSSSSDSSQASEENTPEFDLDNSSQHGGYAAENGMSQRQTKKINSGKFGMFNRPVLTSRSLRTPNSGGRKSNRVEKSSGSHPVPSSRRSGKKRRYTTEVASTSHDNDDDTSLFVAENSSQPEAISGEDELEHEAQLYSNMSPERARRAKEYLKAVEIVDKAADDIQSAETELEEVTTEQTFLSRELATINDAAEKEVSDIIRERDQAIKVAEKLADSKVKKIREQLPLKKARCEERTAEVGERKKANEEHMMEAKTKLQETRRFLSELEMQGAFQLGLDVADIRAKGRGKRK